MSSFLKILLVVAIVAIVILAIRATKKNETEVQPVPEQTLSEGNGDTDLNSDLSTIDAELKAVDENSADIDAGLNDKQLQ